MILSKNLEGRVGVKFLFENFSSDLWKSQKVQKYLIPILKS